MPPDASAHTASHPVRSGRDDALRLSRRPCSRRLARRRRIRRPSAPALPPSPAAARRRVNGAPTEYAADEGGVAWLKGDVDAAFAKAKAENKPLFLYWGAVWCPPCNQVKATIFNRQDFIERSRFFVPVYIDGDSQSAQRLGARFKVGGYPTMILFTPDGTEITRLPGEVDADQYMRVLAMGMNGARPVKTTLAAALAPRGAARTEALARGLADARLLFVGHRRAAARPAKGRPGDAARLAQACPADQTATATRLALKAIARGGRRSRTRSRPTTRSRRDRSIEGARRPALARENFDLLTDAPTSSATSRCRSRASAQLVGAWDAALQRFVADASLSADRPAVGRRSARRAREARHARRRSSRSAAGERARRRSRAAKGRPPTPTRAKSVISGAAQRAGRRRPLRRVRRAAQRGAHASRNAVLLHARPRRQREEARRQGGRGRLARKGLRRGERSGDAPAMGRRLRQHADRSHARRRRAHREGGGAGDRRTRSRARHVLRPQPSRARAHGQEARRLEQGRTSTRTR